MPTQKQNVSLSISVPMMASEGFSNTVFSVPMAPSSTSSTLSATGGSTRTVHRLRISII